MTIAENPQHGKERPRLPDFVDDFSLVAWHEIKRAPDGLSTVRCAQVVADTLVRDYEMSPVLQNYLIRFALIHYLMELLEPEEVPA